MSLAMKTNVKTKDEWKRFLKVVHEERRCRPRPSGRFMTGMILFQDYY